MARNRSSNLHQHYRNKKALAKKVRVKQKYLRETPVDSSVLEDADLLAKFPNVMIVEVKNAKFQVMVDEATLEVCLSDKITSDYSRYFVVGDTVAIDVTAIVARAPRKSFLARMRGDNMRFATLEKEEHTVAANVDIAVIVATAAEPKFHAGLVDRYLIIAQNGGVAPIICFNKCDLITERPEILAYYRDNLGIPVVEVSARTGQGVEELKKLLTGKIAVLVGNSGVGKSSITNLFQLQLDVVTQEVSARNKEGKHTTRTTNLYEWEKGSFLIDTPGIRSLGISHIGREDLKYYFQEFDLPCRYNDCLHDHEEEVDCAVKQAVSEGKIHAYRYESYRRMLEDLV